MRKLVATLLLSVALCLGAQARAPEQPESRAHTAAVAQAMEAQYFDPVLAKLWANALRRDAKRGDFDAFADPASLAQHLTARLQALDGHLRVRPAEDARDAPADSRNATAPRDDETLPSPNRQPRMRPRLRPVADGQVASSRVPDTAKPDESGTAAGIRDVRMLEGDVGYLSPEGFADFDPVNAVAPERTAMDAALRQLAGSRAMIIDLRGNRGGSPAMVGYLVSAFVAPGADIYNTFRTRQGNHSEAPRLPYAKPRTDVPLYVLIDAKTGSAAESFAYTLLQAGRATLVGEPSGGAANPGRYFPAGAALEVFVPTGSPLNPISGSNWEGVGVRPTVRSTSAQALDQALQLARKTTR